MEQELKQFIKGCLGDELGEVTWFAYDEEERPNIQLNTNWLTSYILEGMSKIVKKYGFVEYFIQSVDRMFLITFYKE